MMLGTTNIMSQRSLQNSPLESSCVVVALIENYSTSNPLKVSPTKSQILGCDTLVANERFHAVSRPSLILIILFDINRPSIIVLHMSIALIIDYNSIPHALLLLISRIKLNMIYSYTKSLLQRDQFHPMTCQEGIECGGVIVPPFI